MMCRIQVFRSWGKRLQWAGVLRVGFFLRKENPRAVAGVHGNYTLERKEQSPHLKMSKLGIFRSKSAQLEREVLGWASRDNKR